MNITIRLEDERYARLQRIALARNKSINELVVDYLEMLTVEDYRAERKRRLEVLFAAQDRKGETGVGDFNREEVYGSANQK